MNDAHKRNFPGRNTKAQIAEKKQRQKERRLAEAEALRKRRAELKATHKQFLQDIGPATRLLMVRRGITAFLTMILVEIGMGSAHFLLPHSEHAPDKETSYKDAFKRAYNVKILFDHEKRTRTDNSKIPDGTYTITAIILLLCGLYLPYTRRKNDKKIAKKMVETVMDEISGKAGSFNISNFLHNEDMARKLHPVCRSIIENMSSQYPVLFDRLITEKTDFITYDYALAVIKGYLKTHPDDMQKVLDTYHAETIPDHLRKKYASRTR